jgi:hypothetical protein
MKLVLLIAWLCTGFDQSESCPAELRVWAFKSLATCQDAGADLMRLAGVKWAACAELQDLRAEGTR